MLKILISYASIGSGHTSAAAALKDAFGRQQGVHTMLINAFEHASPLLRATINDSYRYISEGAPGLYRLFYESTDSSAPMTRLLQVVEAVMLTRVKAFIDETAPDAIISVYPWATHGLHAEQAPARLSQPLYVVVTDFLAHRAWLDPDASGYFVASEVTREAMIGQGVPPALIHATGIPVSPAILKPKDGLAMRQAHGLPAERPLVTLFGGGLNPERARLIVQRLLASPLDGTLVVVAGRNQGLREALAGLDTGARMNLRLLGHVNYVDDLVAASDLIVTKAGGLIVSEILARGRPMVIIDPIPGQEEANADFVAACGAGVQLRLAEMVAPTVLMLLARPDRLEQMRAAARAAGRPRAALDIAEHVVADLRRLEQPVTTGRPAAGMATRPT